jgi:hypothetical protein
LTDTLALFGWGKAGTLALRTVLTLAVIFFGAFVAGDVEVATSKTKWLLYGAVATACLFLLVYIVYVVCTPHRLDAEHAREQEAMRTQLSGERDAAISELRRWNDRQAVGQRLEKLWHAGDEFRRSARDTPEWKIDVVNWFARVNAEGKGCLPPDEQFMLETHSSPPDVNLHVITVQQLLAAQLGKLRLVISRCLRPTQT